MAHSVELLLDSGGESAIRTLWQQLDDAGLPSQSQVKAPTNRPHVTLIAAPRISPEVDEVLRALTGRFPVDCVVGAPLVFGGPPDRQRRSAWSSYTLARLIVPSAELLALHDEVYRLTVPYVTGAAFPHCRPGEWTAHATLARRLTAAQIGAAMAVVNSAAVDLRTEIAGLRRWDSDERADHLLVG